MALRLITAPAVEPITLEEAKMHLRVDHSEEDAKIQTIVRAARYMVDGRNGYLGRALVTQTWELVIDHFPTNEIKIPLPPLQQVISVKYDDTGGAEQSLTTSDYDVDAVSEPGWIVPAIGGWPTGVFQGINAVRIQFIAGYLPSSDSPPDLAANVPFDIKAAMLLHIGMMYASRESIVVGTNAMPLPQASEILLRRYRVLLGLA
jgi:uncharacterized phiE125 gp8 family phage protein